MNFCSILWRPASLFVSLLSVLEDLALKNFSSRENWVGSEVAGMKIAFYHF